MAQSWDNVGLLAGDPKAACRKLLLCIDLTTPVVDEAVAGKCAMVMAYHPPIFRPIKRLLADSHETDATVHRAIAAGIAIYSPHTALDAAPGGTNDVIAGLCDLTDIEPFEYTSGDSDQCKIVTFVPGEKVDAVSFAMAAAGAGRIGAYELCSYRTSGEGTFFGTAETNPKVGRRGRLEKVSEIRVEMVAPRRRLPEIIDALLRAHPYEEPAYDIYPLAGTPSFGIGRVGRLPARMTLGGLAESLKRKTGSRVVSIVGKPATRIGRAAVCVGAAGLLPLEKPRSSGCDAVVTGEIRHHDALALLRMGRTAIALGHWESERPVLPVLARRLTEMVPGLQIRVSRKDAPPFV
jgi:dinuclear metal center YbgI/SA1388 family protein